MVNQINRKVSQPDLNRNMLCGRSLMLGLALSVASLSVGCGGGVEIGQVTGVVTKGGEPADSILVNFMPDPETGTEGAMSSAITDDQGRYELTYQGETKEKGAAVGGHRVIFNDLVPENFRGRGRPPAPRVSVEMMDPSATPFRREVKPGAQQLDFDLDG